MSTKTKYSGSLDVQTSKDSGIHKAIDKRTVAKAKTGKSSDPSFTQTTLYLPRQVMADVKVSLLKDPASGDFSELVGSLLVDWLKRK
jgi:hypothetical protein